MTDQDLSTSLAAWVKDAAAQGRPLAISGLGGKAFYGHPVDGERLSLADHRGIVRYEPTELVLTARAGTPISQIEQLLAANGQMLAFEPPKFGGDASLGGAIASGLSGPRRPWGGAPRDHLLGVKLLDGQGRILRFGGEVMKNVAGYDVARLMAGALGTLGILLELSIKVLPTPAVERNLVLDLRRERAMQLMRDLARQPVPLSGACYLNERLYLRLSGNNASVDAWERQIGGERDADGQFWQRLRDQQINFFDDERPLWRLSLAPATPRLDCEQQTLIDWAGAQRWTYSGSDAAAIRSQVAEVGGHATLFRHNADDVPVFHPVDPVRERLHRGLKQTFDPRGVLNPGRQYPAI